MGWMEFILAVLIILVVFMLGVFYLAFKFDQFKKQEETDNEMKKVRKEFNKKTKEK